MDQDRNIENTVAAAQCETQRRLWWRNAGIALMAGLLIWLSFAWTRNELLVALGYARLVEESMAEKDYDRAMLAADRFLQIEQRPWIRLAREVYRNLYQREFITLPDNTRVRARGMQARSLHLPHITVPTGYADAIRSVTFSPDGGTVALETQDGDYGFPTIRLWDVASGRENVVTRGRKSLYVPFAFSPDGRILAAVAEDGTIQLWELASGREAAVLEGHGGSNRSIAFSPDGRTIASVGSDYATRLWDAATGRQTAVYKNWPAARAVSSLGDGFIATNFSHNVIYVMDVPTGHETVVLPWGYEDWFVSVAFSPDGSIIASGSEDKHIRLWNAATGDETARLTGHTDAIRSVVFSPNGKTLASSSADGSIRLWNVADGLETAVLTGPAVEIQSVAFSPNGRALASNAADGSIRLWNLDSGRETAVIRGTTGLITSFAFSPDGRTIASGSSDGVLRLWNVGKKPDITVLDGPVNSSGTVALSPNGDIMAFGTQSTTIRLQEIASGRETTVLKGCLDFAFSPDGRTIATSCTGHRFEDASIRLWDTATGREKAVFEGCRILHFPLFAFSPNGDTIALYIKQDNKEILTLWDLAEGREKGELAGFPWQTYAITFSPDGRLMASGHLDDIHLWDVAGGRKTASLTGHTCEIVSLVFSPKGETLASASQDDTLRLWDVATGRETAVIQGGSPIAFGRGGDIMAFRSSDNTLRFWDLAAGRETAVFEGATHFAFSPNGSIMAFGTDDGTIRLQDAATGRELGVLKSYMALTGAEAGSPDSSRPASLHSLDFSPNGRLIVSAYTFESGRRPQVIMWDVTQLPLILSRLENYIDTAVPYAMNPDGRLVPENPVSLTRKQLEAARQGKLYWLPDGGRQHVPLFEKLYNDVRTVQRP